MSMYLFWGDAEMGGWLAQLCQYNANTTIACPKCVGGRKASSGSSFSGSWEARFFSGFSFFDAKHTNLFLGGGFLLGRTPRG